ncbi:zinc ribbon domain-containing protein [Sporosarcina ureilytica]|uniref:DZANK-type domain-containing protein n=1 Tax=Sporosarcina ureilytica TaxID=298596 RepID=A0A1D8JJ00_9BACL|nr:zinc ribbon domain-containing protein [Sporosarcina ureilytica]AOV08686.1 hypothetical protein BI350_14825 [Sporosarcina ureilytica]
MHCTNCSEAISDLAEVCPKCGVRQNTVKKYCHGCGEPVKEIQEMCTSCGVSIKKTNKSSGTGEAMHPAIPALLSFLIAGLGQLVNGQVAKGIVCFIGSIILAFITIGISAIITMPMLIIDAYLIAKKRQEGKQVGDWEFF